MYYATDASWLHCNSIERNARWRKRYCHVSSVRLRECADELNTRPSLTTVAPEIRNCDRKANTVGMCISCNLVNVYTKLVNVYCTKRYTNMAANNKTQMVLSHDNSVEVSNDQQSPMTSTEQPAVKFVHPIIAWLCSKSLTGHVVLLRHTRKFSFESRFRKKLARIEHVLIVKVYFEKKKNCQKFSRHTCKISFESHFRKRVSKEHFLVCHYL